MNKNSNPLVSVLMLTYNHSQYIQKAIESVLSQDTEYLFELIICDDASTDGTQDIVRQCAEKDHRIVLSLQSSNSKFGKNFVDGCMLIRGKYVAFCEGDDYWTNPHKLQIQVSFLEQNPDFSICAHRVEMLNMDNKQPNSHAQFIFKDCTSDEQRIKDGIFYADEAIANYYFQTGSLVLRWKFKEGLPHWFRQRMMFDHFMFMIHAVDGKIKYFDVVMSVWRRHGGGYTWLQTQDKGLFFQKEGEDWIAMYERMDEFFSKRFTWQIRERILLALRSIVSNCIETSNIDHLRYLIGRYENYFDIILKDAVLIDALRIVCPENRKFSPPWESIRSKERKNESALELELDDSPVEKHECNYLPAIGGYYELALDDIPQCSKSVWDVWVGDKEYARFFNLRSALMRWLWQNGVSTIWLPSYRPPILDDNRLQCQFRRKFYAVDARLDPDSGFLRHVEPGEAVLTISYLGRPLSNDFISALSARKNILWIEDRAQCLTSTESLADAVIYSPHKLFGVPDGGLLVGTGAYELERWCLPASVSEISEKYKFLSERFEQRSVISNRDILGFAKEDMKQQLSRKRMSRITESILHRLPFAEIAQKRRENWQYLYEHLKQFCLWDIACPDFAPYAFPLLLPKNYPTEIMHTILSRNNIFCQRMWYPMFPEHNHHPVEESIAKRLLLVPCDQRYGKNEMKYISKFIENNIK